jgi:hypothetical protein
MYGCTIIGGKCQSEWTQRACRARPGGRPPVFPTAPGRVFCPGGEEHIGTQLQQLTEVVRDVR